MNTHADEKICDNCNKKFKVVTIYHNSRVDENRESFYCCPFCGFSFPIFLRGNEDVVAREP